MANLSLKHIYKVYDNGTKAVNDFNMEIEDKEFIVFVGPSGCGKSTTLRMIAGLEDITAGELRIGDTVVNDVEAKDRDIAMVFQNYALYPHMTVYENMAFGLQLRHMPREEIHEKILAAAKILGITDYLDKKPRAMSGGERQRVALGRAILREPKVFLLDEPLSNLDAKLRAQMRTEISRLHQKLQTTFIYVTHDQVEAMTMGTRIVVMKGGFVQQIDTPKNLFNYPDNKFVAGFIGTPQMNFFDVNLLKKGDDVTVTLKATHEKIILPATAFIKVLPEYLQGKKDVVLGLRCENILLKPTDKANMNSAVNVKILNVEDLGNETLLYCDLLGHDSDSLEINQIIVKAYGDDVYHVGDKIKIYLDVDKAHFFDKETENNISLRIPEYNVANCCVRGIDLTILGKTLQLPPAMRCKAFDGDVLIPTTAIHIKEHGVFSGKVIKDEIINGQHLIHFTLGDQTMFCLSEKPIAIGSTINVDFEYKKLTFRRDNEIILNRFAKRNKVPGKFIAKREKLPYEDAKGHLKYKKQNNFFMKFLGHDFPASDELARKIFNGLGTKAFSKNYRYEFTPYEIKVGGNGDIYGTVLNIIDYGQEKFAEIKVGVDVIYVNVENDISGEVLLSLDTSDIRVYEKDFDIRLV